MLLYSRLATFCRTARVPWTLLGTADGGGEPGAGPGLLRSSAWPGGPGLGVPGRSRATGALRPCLPLGLLSNHSPPCNPLPSPSFFSQTCFLFQLLRYKIEPHFLEHRMGKTEVYRPTQVELSFPLDCRTLSAFKSLPCSGSEANQSLQKDEFRQLLGFLSLILFNKDSISHRF